MTGQYQPGQGFVSSPRMALAQALMAQGASREPVRSPVEGIARLLTAGIGGWVGSGVKKDQQDALADALKALEDPSVPDAGRAKAAYQAYATKSPDTPNPFEGIMLSGMLPKERWEPVKNSQGQTIGQKSSLTGKIEPYKLENISAGTTAVNPFGEAVAIGGPKLGEGQVYDPKTGTISTVPNFTQSLAEIEAAKSGGKLKGEMPFLQERNRLEATGTGQGQAATAADIARNRERGTAEGQLATVQTPNGPMPAVAAVQRATQVGQRQGQNAVPTATPGYRMEEDRMVPIEGGAADPATIKTVAQATEEGQQAGKGTAPVSDAERKWREEFKKPIDQAADLVTQRNVIKTSLAKADGTGDIAAITAFNKLLDPGAVVREADVNLTLAAQGVADRLAVWMQNKQQGDILPPDLRRRMDELSDAIFKTSAETIKARVLPYQSVIEKSGANFGNVVPLELQTNLGWVGGIPKEVQSGMPNITNDAAGRSAFDALAPGTPYVGPDGVTYIKPRANPMAPGGQR